MAFFSIT